ncbi:hypothetical protein B0T44_24165, partial [Nocardia donostiensis]
LSYGAGLAVTGSLLAIAAIGWLIVPEPLRRETRETSATERAETAEEEAERLAASCTCDGGPGGGSAVAPDAATASQGRPSPKR